MLSNRLTRRAFVARAAAATAALSARPIAWAQTNAPFKRYSVSSPQGQAMLVGYEKAIRTMLQLPPEDPHNWYRNALRHTLDCPHGNFWFLPWHRGYTGWFETIVRRYSGIPQFAFPYWDWTETPSIPKPFQAPDSVLNPENELYVAGLDEFRAKYKPAVDAMYAKFTPEQNAVMQLRHYDTSDILFENIRDAGGDTMFPPRAQARRAYDAEFSLRRTAQFSVSAPVVDCALEMRTFYDFGSYPAGQHFEMTQFGVFEGFAHNDVHNDFEGFMQDNMSPTDPLFALHHSNIDRLWMKWHTMRLAAGDDPLPLDADRAKWEAEPFLFFVGPDGESVAQNTCASYVTPDLFGYEYVEPRLLTATRAVPMAHTPRALVGLRSEAAAPAAEQDGISRFHVPLPKAPDANGKRMLAAAPLRSVVLDVTVQGHPMHRGERLNLFLRPASATPDETDPGFMGTLEFFGLHRHMGAQVVFTVPLCDRLLNCMAKKAAWMKNKNPDTKKAMDEACKDKPVNPPALLGSLSALDIVVATPRPAPTGLLRANAPAPPTDFKVVSIASRIE